MATPSAIIDSLVSALENINGSGDYHFSVTGAIHRSFKLVTDVDVFPSVWIEGCSWGGLAYTNPKDLQASPIIRVYGYIREDEDVLTNTMYLLEDMMRAVMSSGGLSGTWNNVLKLDSAVWDQFGVVVMEISCNTEFCIT